jgi:hypothetical protein
MARYAIVDTNNNALITVVEYDSAPSTPPPGYAAGFIAIQSDFVGNEWSYNGTVLVAPPVKTPAAIAPAIVVAQSYRASLIRKANDLQAQGKSFEAVQLLLKANSQEGF